MISFDLFKPDSASPVYLQIAQYIKRGIASGQILDGDEMPSRRVLSALIGINPNTVQKAYKLLEDEGIIYSRSGAKSYIKIDDDQSDAIKNQLFTKEIQALADGLKAAGLTLQQAKALMEEAWENSDKGEKDE